MKKIWLLVTTIALLSCEPEKKVDYAIVSGKITNADAKKITIYNQFNTSDKTEIMLADDGSFKDTLKMDTDSYLFRQGRNMTQLFAPEGSKVSINYNAKKKDSTINITGDFNAVNNYFIAKNEITKTEMGDRKELYLKDEDNFVKHLKKIKTAQEDLLFNTNGIPEEYKNKETKNINYEYLSSLNNYQSYHGYYSKNREFKVSENFLKEVKELNLENENDFLFSSNYRNLVSSNYRIKARELAKKDSIANDIAYLKTLANIKNDKIRNKLLYDDARFGITYTDNLENYYTIFSNSSTNIENNKKVEKDYKKLKALASGSVSPKFTNYENNAGGTTSLDDLKGKYVYIDVWATWCGPCIGEIPSLKKLEKQFHSNNIEFVSISIDDKKDHEKWKKMIVDKELGGVQLFADNNWDSKFVQDYMIKGIPRFILIDPKGNIVNANAPRPSDKKLVTTFKELKI